MAVFAENSAEKLSRAKRYREATRVLIDIERINEGLLAAQLVARFDAEQVDLKQIVNSLATNEMINRVTLGSARVLVEEHRIYPEAIRIVLDEGWTVVGRRFIREAAS